MKTSGFYMTKKRYVLFIVLLAGIGNFGVQAGINDKSTPISVKNDELIKTLPTALLENLKRDLQAQEEKENKIIDSIAGISRDRLENEIRSRMSEDRSATIGKRIIDPKLLPGNLLKYIADHGISYEGCNPEDASNEIQNRIGISDDLPSVLVSSLQEKNIHEEQKKSAEDFSKREDAEDLSDAFDEIRKNIEEGKNPSVVKQAEFVKEREERANPPITEALRQSMEGKKNPEKPHGYDEAAQNDRSSEEIDRVKQDIEKRALLKKEKNKEQSFWDKTKKKVRSWLGNKKSNTSNEKQNKNSGFIDEKTVQNLASALTTAVEDAS